MKLKHHLTLALLTGSFLLLPPRNGYAFRLTGKVTDKSNGSALSGVTVYLRSPYITDSLLTDQSGSWSYELSSATDSPKEMPRAFALGQNYPNPFNPTTTIEFQLPQAEKVTIRISNLRGQIIAERSASLVAGNYAIDFNGGTSAGLYFYTLIAGPERITRRMIQMDGSGTNTLGPIRAIATPPHLTLTKIASTPISLIFKKYGYANDTITTVIAQDTYFETQLESIHFYATVADLHNDILEVILTEPDYHLNVAHSNHHTDLPRLRAGGVDLQVFAVWASPSTYPYDAFAKSKEMVARLEAEIALAPNQLGKARNFAEAQALWQQSKIAAVIGVEGGHHIENSLEKLHWLYDQGMRIMTITWNNSTDWAISAQDEANGISGGLTEFGRQVIRTLDSLGVIIDVSHVGPKTIDDILSITKNPIIASHSGVKALRNHFRNLSDDQIRAIAATGGVIGVIFYPPFLTSNYSASINTVISHIDYIVSLVGIDYVALGSDFDGIERTVSGLENTSKFPALTSALLQHGYTNEQIQQILGGNFLRVFRQVCKSPSLP